MKKTLLILGAMVVASVSAFGAQFTDVCAGETHSATMTFSNTLTNVECGDKIFTNFTSTGAVSGTVTFKETSATSYEVLFITSTVGGITTNFSYGFTVSVDTTVCATCRISQIQQNMQTEQAGSTGTSIPNGSTGTNTINNGGVFNPAVSNALTVGGQNSLASGLNNTSYTLGFAYNPTGTAGQAPGTFLNLDNIINQVAVPEPMTLSMMGIGLLGLGLMRRRQMGKK